MEGDHKYKIMDRPFKLKYGTVSQVLLQLVVASEGFVNLGSSKRCTTGEIGVDVSPCSTPRDILFY